MNSPIRKITAAALLALAAIVANQANAIPIQGTINFGGGGALINTPDNLAAATTIMGIAGDTVSGGYAAPTGDYAGLTGDAVTFTTPLVFSPFSGLTTPLWTVSVGAVQYTFDITTLTIVTQSSTLLDLEGQGIAAIIGSGYDPTAGSWTIQVTGSGTNLSFQSTAAVPDSSSTAMLIGMGLLGVGLAARSLKKTVKA